MQAFEAVPRWWDRDVDESGQLLRVDVRESAHKIWTSVCAQARHILGDATDAPELLESAVKAVSRYLDGIHAPLHAADPGGLLVLAFQRSLRRLSRKSRRSSKKKRSGFVSAMRRNSTWRSKGPLLIRNSWWLGDASSRSSSTRLVRVRYWSSWRHRACAIPTST